MSFKSIVNSVLQIIQSQQATIKNLQDQLATSQQGESAQIADLRKQLDEKNAQITSLTSDDQSLQSQLKSQSDTITDLVNQLKSVGLSIPDLSEPDSASPSADTATAVVEVPSSSSSPV